MAYVWDNERKDPADQRATLVCRRNKKIKLGVSPSFLISEPEFYVYSQAMNHDWSNPFRTTLFPTFPASFTDKTVL